MGLDKNSFEKLFRDFYPSLCSFACKYLEDPAQAEDFAQDVFITLWDKRGEMNTELSIKSYLYTAVKNRCLNHLRQQAVRQRFSESELHKKELPAYFRDSLIEEETHRLIYQAVNELSERCRDIIRLNLEGLKNQEIADLLSISVNTVKTQKAIAYRQLRLKLKPALAILPLVFQHIPF